MSKKNDPVLFRVLIDRSGYEQSTDFIMQRAVRTHRCVQELLHVTGVEARLTHNIDKVGKDWMVVFHVSPNFMTQFDLFEVRRTEQVTVKEVAATVIEAAIVAIRRFRQETGGVIATRIEQTLKQLRSADPRVIQALFRQPSKTLTVRNEVGDFSLSVQSESSRPVNAEAEPLIGVIKTVGTDELTIQPVNKRSPAHVCIHTFRVRIPEPLRLGFDPIGVLNELVRPKVRVHIMVQREVVVRRRDQQTFLLAAWPPTAGR